MSAGAGPGPVGRRVLLVGDADDHARIVAALLEAAGIVVVGPVAPAASDPSGGEDVAARPDAVLLLAASCRQASVTVAATLAALRRAHPAATLTVLTDMLDDAVELLADGADEVLAGPLTLHTLLEGLHLADAGTDDPLASDATTDGGPGAALGWLPPLAVDTEG